MPKFRSLLAAVTVLLAVTLTYSNHFHNAFQFDDFHTIQGNVYIRNLANIPRFFSDATTFSVLPANRTWRPLVSASLALDYWLGKGYEPFYFHLSTFLWFLTLLVLLARLFQIVLDRLEPGPRNLWIAWFAAAWFGLHPAIAETVNYIIQRADLMSTWGMVAGLLLYARLPAWRTRGLYLLPVLAALLCKAPALIFPAILGAYIFLIEEDAARESWGRVVRRCLPALGLSVAFILLQSALTPKSFTPGTFSAYRYLITQPYVWFRCFVAFFLPLHLTADTDLAPVETIFSLEAAGGFLFLAALFTAIYFTAARKYARPVAFGLTWFALGLLPTSVFPLAEVENDHRMFLPFIGLALAVSWIGACIVRRQSANRGLRVAVVAGAICLLLVYAGGTRRRNQVWHSSESLWEDVTLKSPTNGRGLMNYGLARMSAGDFATARIYFERALPLTPNYPQLAINMGIDYTGLGRDADAEQQFQRAIALAPASADGHFFYGRWLSSKGRHEQALSELRTAVTLNPSLMDSRLLLLQVYADHAEWADLKMLATDTLRIAPDDPAVRRFVDMNPGDKPSTPESLVNLSLEAYSRKDFEACIRLAREALKLRPDYAEAYNNIAAANNELGRWNLAIEAGRQAVRLKPDFQLARNNLKWAESQASKSTSSRQ